MTARWLTSVVVLAVGASASVMLAACGGDDGSDAPAGLSAEARRGAELADDRGCSSCHRSGAVAPRWEGLYGSTVELEDGSTVTADEEYLARSITDPGADVVAGYGVSMPDNDLDDQEVAAVVAYIRELGAEATTTSGGGR